MKTADIKRGKKSWDTWYKSLSLDLPQVIYFMNFVEYMGPVTQSLAIGRIILFFLSFLRLLAHSNQWKIQSCDQLLSFVFLAPGRSTSAMRHRAQFGIATSCGCLNRMSPSSLGRRDEIALLWYCVVPKDPAKDVVENIHLASVLISQLNSNHTKWSSSTQVNGLKMYWHYTLNTTGFKQTKI